MVTNHLAYSSTDYGLHLAGITAHVYADTFSHYGFSGVSSRGNKVKQGSFEFSDDLDVKTKDYILEKAVRFFQKDNLLPNIKSKLLELISAGKATIAESVGALGHGSVATYPDRPYLSWRFNYEDKNETDSGWRHNQKTFLEGCHALYDFFRLIAIKHPEHSNSNALNFSDIEASVKEVLAFEAPCAGRIDVWQRAARSGSFGKAESIPEYSPEAWSGEWKNLQQSSEDSNNAHDTNIFQFYRAAAYHRVFVLRDLLPNHGLIVD